MFGPLSKNNTGMAALSADLPVKIHRRQKQVLRSSVKINLKLASVEYCQNKSHT